MFVTTTALRTTALTVLLGCFAYAHPSFAAPVGQEPISGGPPSSTMMLDSSGHIIGQTPDRNVPAPVTEGRPLRSDYQQGAQGEHHGMMKHSSEAMQQAVETRIKTLHAKLQITAAQESDWNDVAQAMRDNEATISSLIQSRHKSAGNMTAVEDLESYQQIAQAHADGLRKVISAFTPLYNSISDAQKKNADHVFGGYEGQGDWHGKHKGMKHMKSNPTSPSK